ncbi:MAG: restriction endonuclease [Candidatus Bathyarchaeia archaeon]
MSRVSTSLDELASKYFHKKGYEITSEIIIEGASGILHKFDLLITKSNEKRVAQILDWKRTVGVNIVINLDKASEDVAFKKPILISEKFSSHAKAYANRKGITLLTKRELNKF